ncbi:MAG: Rieske 2Fe-2S domain-containing protein [Alphaproteobacteria bacterium]
MSSAAAAADSFVRIDRERGLFKVRRDAFWRQDVLERERDLIFSKCWIYAGHESEIVKPGDFVTRPVGGRNLIFNRDKAGKVRAFLNTCPHRGSTVCREKRGNAKTFQCFYHGWVFRNTGELADQPGSATGYSPQFNADGSANLMEVPHLDSYRGFYFVNYDASPVALADYLGNAREYLDLIVDQSEIGMEVVGGTQEYSVRANWKLLSENSIDGYHASTTHATYIDYLMSADGGLNKVALVGPGKDLGNGHAVMEYTAPWGRPIAQWVPIWGEQGRRDIEAIRAKLEQRFGKERAERIATTNRNLLIFPNLIVNDIMAITIRTYYPQQPDYMFVNAWTLAPREEDSKFRERRLASFLEFLGPGGFATPDDVEALENCQTGYKNSREASWNDISKGMLKPTPAMDDEIQMRAFWTQWNRIIAQPAFAQAAE